MHEKGIPLSFYAVALSVTVSRLWWEGGDCSFLTVWRLTIMLCRMMGGSTTLCAICQSQQLTIVHERALRLNEVWMCLYIGGECGECGKCGECSAILSCALCRSWLVA